MTDRRSVSGSMMELLSTWSHVWMDMTWGFKRSLGVELLRDDEG